MLAVFFCELINLFKLLIRKEIFWVGVLHDGAFQQVDVGGEGDDVVQEDKLHTFVVSAVRVYFVVFKVSIVFWVYAEGAQKSFERRFVGMHVEKHVDTVVIRVARDGEVVVAFGQFAAHGLVGR